MSADPTVNMMSATFPYATRRLLDTIDKTVARATSSTPIIHESDSYVMTSLVEPMLDALGFAPHRQQMEFKPFEHVILTVNGHDTAMLILKTLGDPKGQDEWVDYARRESQFPGRIIVTNGIEWSIYHPNAEIPDLHFDLTQPAAFWDLLVMGQANGHGFSEIIKN